MPDSSTPVEVFYSYAHKDETFRNKLETHLSLLQRQGLITAWHDRHILPGTDWAQAIDEHLERASVILLLISADFLASGYCYGLEMQRALERHKANEARVIPILLRSVDWKGAPFAHLQALPTGAKPISTWRNRDAAFTDVATSIRRVIEDLFSLSASAPRAALPPVWNIPFARNPFFTGREELLQRLQTQLRTSQTAAFGQLQTISGLGGIGKTQLAVEYAHRYLQEYQAVLWAHAETMEALTTSYTEIARLLQLPQKDAQEQEVIVQGVKDWLSMQQNWLLILDNADEPDVLIPFLPPRVGGHIIVTTRASDLSGLGLGFGHPLAVETFPDDQGALFLLHRADLLAVEATLEDASPQDREGARQIAHELGGLPLALDQAGAYLNATGCGLVTYRQLYQQHRAELLKKRHGHDHAKPVATTWDISFQRVEATNPAAADLLRLSAFLAPDAIPEEILTEGTEEQNPTPDDSDLFLLNEGIESLRAYSLIARDQQARTLTVHRLVQAVLRDSLPVEDQQQWLQHAVHAVTAAYPELDFVNWVDIERLLPHALSCAIWIERLLLTTPAAALLLNQTGFYLKDRGRYKEAEPLSQRALAIREQLLGTEHPDTAQSLNNLANIYGKLGRDAEAEPLVQRALAINEKASGVEHPNTARSLNDLAGIYTRQGRYVEAEPLLQRALAINEKVSGVEHPNTARSLNNLANLYRRQGKLTEAEPLYTRALAIRKQQLGPEHPETAQSLKNLARLYQDQEKYAEAEPLFRSALSIREQHFGSQHIDTATSLIDLASFLKTQGKYAEAEPLFRSALSIREQHLGPDHSSAVITRRNYAHLLRAMGRDTEAEAIETKQILPS